MPMERVVRWDGAWRWAAGVLGVLLLVQPGLAQRARKGSVIVQPGAPGKEARVLPATTKARLTPISAADVQFMQGMITHHAQAVEMTALIETRTTNEEVRSLGARISHSQADEIRMMKRWLLSRGYPVEEAGGHHHHHGMMHGLMPGMLTPKQMEALAAARGEEFDRLFLEGMIMHHGGALTMVEELFAVAGAGQEAEIFHFATDVDSGQRAEIRVMQTMREKLTKKENR
ncbi:MAG: DUF305 domain-containing protein [Blastocatellia bacterium]